MAQSCNFYLLLNPIPTWCWVSRVIAWLVHSSSQFDWLALTELKVNKRINPNMILALYIHYKRRKLHYYSQATALSTVVVTDVAQPLYWDQNKPLNWLLKYSLKKGFVLCTVTESYHKIAWTWSNSEFQNLKTFKNLTLIVIWVVLAQFNPIQPKQPMDK